MPYWRRSKFKMDAAALDDEEFYKNLLIAAGKEDKEVLGGLDQPEGKYVLPEPRCVIKVKNDNDEKVFLNICTSNELPAPRDISEEELAKLLDDPDALNFRVPIGLGNPHAEVDKTGNGLFNNKHISQLLLPSIKLNLVKLS